jgi:hypothetical protein
MEKNEFDFDEILKEFRGGKKLSKERQMVLSN